MSPDRSTALRTQLIGAVGATTGDGLEARIARDRLGRARRELARAGLAAAVLFEPSNVRFTTGADASFDLNLQHAERWALIPVAGPPIIWEHPTLLAMRDPPSTCLGQRRGASGWDLLGPPAAGGDAFADAICGALRERGLIQGRIGVDQMEAAAYVSLRDAGLRLDDATPAIERARCMKGDNELEAFRRAGEACRAGLEAVRMELDSGADESQLWGVFERAALCRHIEECIRQRVTDGFHRGGGSVSYDIRVRGVAGVFIHLAETFTQPRSAVSASDRRYAAVRKSLERIIDVCHPGMPYDRLAKLAREALPQDLEPRRGSVIAYGCGLIEEFPVISWYGGPPGALQQGTVLNVGLDLTGTSPLDAVHVRDQVIVTDGRPVRLGTSSLEGEGGALISLAP